MSNFPRQYPTNEADGKLDERDWNEMVNRINGFNPSGVFINPLTFTVSTDNTYYYANNAFQTIYGGPNIGDTGTGAGGVDGTDFYAVAQAALSNLTVGRTSKEKVVFIGNFTLNDTLLIDDYTILQLIGKMKLADSADVHMLKNTDAGISGVPGTGNTDIEVFGGEWDGNRGNQPILTPENAVFMTFFQKVTNLEVHDLTVHDCLSDGVHIRTGCDKVKTYNIHSFNNGENGVFFTEASNIELANIESHGQYAGNGVMLGTTADALPVSEVQAENIICYDNSENGVLLLNAEKIHIDCNTYNNGACGVAGAFLTDSKISGITHDNVYGAVIDTAVDVSVDLESFDNTSLGLQLGQGDALTEVNTAEIKGLYYSNGDGGVTALYGSDYIFNLNAHSNKYNGLSLSETDGFIVIGNYTYNGRLGVGDFSQKCGVCLYPSTVNQNGVICCSAKKNGSYGVYVASGSINVIVTGASTSDNITDGILCNEATTAEVTGSWNNGVWITTTNSNTTLANLNVTNNLGVGTTAPQGPLHSYTLMNSADSVGGSIILNRYLSGGSWRGGAIFSCYATADAMDSIAVAVSDNTTPLDFAKVVVRFLSDGTVKPTVGYRSTDGTAGATTDVAVAKVGTGTRTLHFKNGLYSSYTDS